MKLHLSAVVTDDNGAGPSTSRGPVATSPGPVQKGKRRRPDSSYGGKVAGVAAVEMVTEEDVNRAIATSMVDEYDAEMEKVSLHWLKL
jgi:hypothetical protein